MKLTKKCPECGGTEIYTSTTVSGAENFNLLPHIGTIFWPEKLEIYICGGCGNHQVFVPEKYLDKVKERYDRHS